tara:strand:- start:3466 stop:3660 length:195 start_codon:yes stop_codon:yes gene_type:complete
VNARIAVLYITDNLYYAESEWTYRVFTIAPIDSFEEPPEQIYTVRRHLLNAKFSADHLVLKALL